MHPDRTRPYTSALAEPQRDERDTILSRFDDYSVDPWPDDDERVDVPELADEL